MRFDRSPSLDDGRGNLPSYIYVILCVCYPVILITSIYNKTRRGKSEKEK